MKVAALKRKFGKHDVGVPFEMQDVIARALIKVGKVEAVTAEISARTGQPKRQYQRRDMKAEGE